ncbi:MAG: HAD family hydrolase [Lachnospiraceae bacterium]|nr:HAD family hydrolase [Lachnospiraceae bacterium]
MFENIEWLFFDIGSTIINEHTAYEHRLKGIAESANVPYETIYKIAVEFYKANKKGDSEAARLFGVQLPDWYTEGEALYDDATQCLRTLSTKYKIGIIANQSLGVKERLQKHGILRYINLVVSSAEEGFAKPDKRIFTAALYKGNCKPENAAMIGDRINNDIVPANLLGFYTIWIRQGFGKYWRISNSIEKPDCIVYNLTQLCDLLVRDEER